MSTGNLCVVMVELDLTLIRWNSFESKRDFIRIFFQCRVFEYCVGFETASIEKAKLLELLFNNDDRLQVFVSSSCE